MIKRIIENKVISLILKSNNLFRFRQTTIFVFGILRRKQKLHNSTFPVQALFLCPGAIGKSHTTLQAVRSVQPAWYNSGAWTFTSNCWLKSLQSTIQLKLSCEMGIEISIALMMEQYPFPNSKHRAHDHIALLWKQIRL